MGCAHQLESGNFLGQAYQYDEMADLKWKRDQAGGIHGASAELPVSMEFSLTNTCNLECIM